MFRDEEIDMVKMFPLQAPGTGNWRSLWVVVIVALFGALLYVFPPVSVAPPSANTAQALAACEEDKFQCLGAFAKFADGDVVQIRVFADESYVMANKAHVVEMALPHQGNWKELMAENAEQYVHKP